jgi:cell division protein FtsI (penicillin-binding protein 3)
MHDGEETKRVRLLARIAVVWALVIFLRLVHLQIFSHDDLKSQAIRQQEIEQIIRPERASILDRARRPLAKSIAVDSVCVNPKRIPDPEIAAAMLAGVLDLEEDKLQSRIAEAKLKRRGFLWIKRKISPAESERLRSLNLDWIEFRPETKRHYPNDELAAHVVGTVDFEEGGSSGVELALNSDLAGRSGTVRMFADVRRRAFDSEIQRVAVPGRDVVLTIDSRIQYIAERELIAAAIRHKARNGSILVMNPKNGEILALADFPTFNPNLPPDPKSGIAARNNVGITSPYEPGSVFKVVTVAAALETKAVRPDTMIHCGNGLLRIGSRAIREAGRGYGVLSVADIIAKSSNIGAIQVAARMGEDKLHEYVRRFGFGQPTGIPLPSESRGMLRKRERWGKTSYASIAMGHEVSVTAIQLAQACSVIANNGALVKPRLIMAKQRAGQEPEIVPSESPVQVIKPETAIEMRRMMERVVLSGTGKGAKLKGYTSGGKTGTAQIFDVQTRKYTHTYNGSFIGFAPVQNPAIVIVVTLNGTSGGTSGYGGAVAAPVFREVANHTLRLLNVPKDLPEKLDEHDPEPSDVNDLSIAGLDPAAGAELASIDPQHLAQASDALSQAFFVGPPANSRVAVGPRVPNFGGKTMREVIEAASAAGIDVEFTGSGVVRAQAPMPGALLASGERIRVHLAR